MGGDMTKYREQRPAKANFAQELLEKNPRMTESTLKGRGTLRFGSWVDSRLNREWVRSFRETGKVAGEELSARAMTTLQTECRKFLESLQKNHSNLITLLKAAGAESFEITLGDPISMSYNKLVKEREEFAL
jgi:hypothetical protein